MKNNHSKLPWHSLPNEEYPKLKDIYGDGGDQYTIDICDGVDPGNAEFIIRAANNFYPLLEACKDAWNIMSLDSSGRFLKITSELSSVIQKAEGGES